MSLRVDPSLRAVNPPGSREILIHSSRPVTPELKSFEAPPAGHVTRHSDGSFTQWNDEISFKPEKLLQPASMSHLQCIIKTHSHVRFVGSGHSMNANMAADSKTALIQLNHLNRVGTVDKAKEGTSRVWIEAGATIEHINAELLKQGYALETLPSSESITLGGAIATGAHGSGWAAPATVAEQAIALQMIDGDGMMREITGRDLRAGVIHLGSLGAVARVQMRVVPKFLLQSKSDVVKSGLSEFELEKLKATVAAHDHVTFLYDPVSGQVGRRFLDRVEPKDVPQGMREKTKYAHETEKLNGKLKFLNGWLMRLLFLTKFLRKKVRKMAIAPMPSEFGSSGIMFQGDFNMKARDMSYGVPLALAQKALKRLTEEFRRIGYEPTFPFSIRVLRSTDKTAIGLNSGRDTAVIEYGAPPAEKELGKVQRIFEAVMQEFDGRPTKARFPAAAWSEFKTFGKRMKNEKFLNDWARKYAPVSE
jgi:L-gulono-1,4-lactone dehydrogenase